MDKLCNSIAIFLFNRQSKKNIPVEVYKYGVYLIISSIGTAFFIICMSCIFDSFFMGLLYLGIYIPLKVTCGGYHAKTIGRCFAVSLTNYFLVMLLTKLLSTINLSIWIWLCILVVNVIFIAISAPVKNRKHNVGKSVIKKNKKYSLIMINVLAILLMIGYFIIEPIFLELYSYNDCIYCNGYIINRKRR